MRRINSVSLSVTLLALLASVDATAEHTLNMARGFAKGKCYEGVASIRCEEEKNCVLMLYPKMSYQLTFEFDKPSQRKWDQKELMLVSFSVTDPKSTRVRILRAQPLSEEDALNRLKSETFLGNPIRCKE